MKHSLNIACSEWWVEPKMFLHCDMNMKCCLSLNKTEKNEKTYNDSECLQQLKFGLFECLCQEQRTYMPCSLNDDDSWKPCCDCPTPLLYIGSSIKRNHIK
mmetsp:Transcript_18180/g.37986  ORF Transcript_18180/g.37986 Transcript_18180/m.37986 type:complete len:101 (-) Transcript_18180:1516-1818(-)